MPVKTKTLTQKQYLKMIVDLQKSGEPTQYHEAEGSEKGNSDRISSDQISDL